MLTRVGLKATGSIEDAPTTDRHHQKKLKSEEASEHVEFMRSRGVMPDKMLKESAASLLKALNVAAGSGCKIRYIERYRLNRDYTNDNRHQDALVTNQGDECEVLKHTGEWAKVRLVSSRLGPSASPRSSTGYVPADYLTKVEPEPEPEPESEPEPEPEIELERFSTAGALESEPEL